MIARRSGRWLLEFAPAFVVALLILPFLMQTGTFWPWHPATVDLEVYIAAVKDFIHGRSIYDTSTPGWELKFIYPPVAAVLMLPMVFGSLVWWQIAWTALLIVCQQAVLRRCGIPRGWPLAVLGAVIVACVEPIRTTIGYGQVNTVLMALVVVDLLPLGSRPRWLPRGVLLGLAAAIKLTPLLFIVFVFFTRRWKLGLTSLVSLALWTGLGAAVMPSGTLRYFAGLAQGQTNTTSPIYLGNQSVLGAFTRFAGNTDVDVTHAGLLAGMAVAGLGTLAAAWWWRRAPVLAVALVGLCTNLASPLSWTHHHVWVIVLFAALLVRERIPSLLRYACAAWVFWLAASLPLATLRFGNCYECHYDPLSQAIAEAAPVGGALIVLAFTVVAGYGIWRQRQIGLPMSRQEVPA